MAYTRINWKNKPSTDTPINATNLNTMDLGIKNVDNATNYLTATATTDGDYKVNIANTLDTNMILNIIFPAATTSASNARLSIDNGTIYKNVFFGIQLSASKIENTTQSIYYDGTQWQVLNMKNLLTAECSTSVSNISTGTNISDFTVVPIASILTVGSKLTISGNKIYIGAGITEVNVSAQGYFTTGIQADDLARILVVKNGNTPILRSYIRVRGTYTMVPASLKSIPVVEGDYLEFMFNNGTRTGSYIGQGDGCYISVQEE